MNRLRKSPDRLLGALTVCLGLGVIFLTFTFPAAQGTALSSAFFPRLLGVFFCLAGALLFCKQAIPDGMNTRLEISPGGILRLCEVVGSVLFYIVFAELLGFFIAATAIVAFLLWQLKNPWRLTLAISLPFVLAIYLLFSELLLVRLPLGPW